MNTQRLTCVLCCVIPQEKASRIDRIVTEHQLFCQGLKELQNWVADTSHMLQTYCTPTADKNVLDSRVIKLEVQCDHL
jgi:nesprin-1